MLRRRHVAAAVALALLAGLAAAATTASAAVATPPSISTFFSQDVVAVGGNVGIQFTISNPNALLPLTGVGFTDPLPAGLVVATVDDLFNDCGGTITDAAGSSSIMLTGGTVDEPVSGAGFCTILVDVTATSAGTKNTTTTGVSSNEAPTGSASNTASVDVIVPPSTTSLFSPATIAANATSTLTFTVTNANATEGLDNIGFSDTLPAGLLVAPTPNVTGSCGSSSRSPGTVLADPGASSIELLALGLDPSSACDLSVDVTAASAGAKQNSTGPVAYSYDSGGGDTVGGTSNAATASLLVIGPPTISAAFGAATIEPGGSTSLSLTLSNPNAADTLTGVGFAETLPAGLALSNPTIFALFGSCGNAQGTFPSDANGFTVSGVTLTPNAKCFASVGVTATGTALGELTNVTSPVTSTEGGTGDPATAKITVAAPTTPTTTTTPPPVTIPPPPSNTFTFSHVKVGKDGSVTFDITLPGPGSVDVLETLGHSSEIAGTRALIPGAGRFVFSRLHLNRKGKGTVHKVRVVPNARGRSVVRHHRRALRINLWITFKPTGGRGHTQHRLHLRLPGH